METTLTFEEFQMTPEERAAKAAYAKYRSEKCKVDWLAERAFNASPEGVAKAADRAERQRIETSTKVIGWVLCLVLGVVAIIAAHYLLPAGIFSIPVTIVGR